MLNTVDVVFMLSIDLYARTMFFVVFLQCFLKIAKVGAKMEGNACQKANAEVAGPDTGERNVKMSARLTVTFVPNEMECLFRVMMDSA